MERISKARIFGAYLRAHTGGLLLAAACAALFYVVLFLYNTPPEPVLYASALSAALAFLVHLVRFLRFSQRVQALTSALSALPESGVHLPEPRTLPEAQYGEVVQTLLRLLSESEEQRRRGRRENADYFTVWVHQIKTPLAAMRLLLHEADTAENRELLAELFRVERYVEMALTYARLESPVTDFVLRHVQVEPVVRRVAREYAEQFVRSRLTFSCDIAPAKVLTDEKWLAFILGQMLSNAVKYTKSGGVTVRMTAEGVLTVTDTGAGIQPEDVPRVFEKGFTGQNGREAQSATGLGMFLSRTAAEKLSHSLTVSSAPGKGTVFTLDMRHTDVWTE